MLSKSSKIILLLFLCQFCLTQCNFKKSSNVEEVTNTIDGKWSLIKFHKLNVELDRSNQSFIPTLEVQVDEKKIVGRDGCNRIYASLSKLENKEIQIGAIGGTKVGCKMDNPYDENYRNLMRSARTYIIKESTLFLFDGKDTKLLEFERVNE